MKNNPIRKIISQVYVTSLTNFFTHITCLLTHHSSRNKYNNDTFVTSKKLASTLIVLIVFFFLEFLSNRW
jgi:hypothetical protein